MATAASGCVAYRGYRTSQTVSSTPLVRVAPPLRPSPVSPFRVFSLPSCRATSPRVLPPPSARPFGLYLSIPRSALSSWPALREPPDTSAVSLCSFGASSVASPAVALLCCQTRSPHTPSTFHVISCASRRPACGTSDTGLQIRCTLFPRPSRQLAAVLARSGRQGALSYAVIPQAPSAHVPIFLPALRHHRACSVASRHTPVIMPVLID